jgi:hypothetical protein
MADADVHQADVHQATSELVRARALAGDNVLAKLRLSALNAADRAALPVLDAPVLDLNLGASPSQLAEQASVVADAIAGRGFCVCRGGLPDAEIAAAGLEARDLFHAGKMKAAFFGGAGAAVEEKSRRQDHHLWLHGHVSAGANGSDAAGSGVGTLARLDGLLAAAGRRVMERLAEGVHDGQPMARAEGGEALHCTGRTDGMVAVYPGGAAAYGAHLDNTDGDGRADFGRCLTLVLYLNPQWDVGTDGGALVVYAPQADIAPSSGGTGGGGRGETQEAPSPPPPLAAYTIPPTGGTFVIFRAEQLMHEVRPAHAERAALTVWLNAGTRMHAAREAERIMRAMLGPNAPP